LAKRHSQEISGPLASAHVTDAAFGFRAYGAAMERFDRRRQILAVSLAWLAGVVDAIGYLSTNNYFVSFMSGNTTRLGVELIHERHKALFPALLIVGFVLGVASGGVVALLCHRRRKAAVLALVAALLCAAAMASSAGYARVTLAMLVLSMGALNNTFQRNGEIAVGLTYMTGALVRLGQAIAAGVVGNRRTDWPSYLVLWLGLASGALAGALAIDHLGAWALWLATAVCAAMILPAARLSAQ
jgi:uncharacterized membrane protein YoaK (UPF0700 family)